jgi:hypothetical protein
METLVRECATRITSVLLGEIIGVIDLHVCNATAPLLKTLFSSRNNIIVRSMASEGQMTQRDYWCEFQHAATRFMSYYRAISTLRLASQLWPRLFHNFKVTFIRSSSPWKRVLKGPQVKHKEQPGLMGQDESPEPMEPMQRKLTADEIIGRMTSNSERMGQSRAHAQQLSMVGLDDRIQQQVCNLSPIVHAEVLVHQSLVNDGFINDPLKFFCRYQYIGSSKPTCRLCRLYFDTYDSDIEVRPSHGNQYINWRVPDVYSSQESACLEVIMTRMLEPIRREAFRTLSLKVSLRSPHDSNSHRSYSSFLSNELVNGGKRLDRSTEPVDGVERLGVILEGLGIGNSRNLNATIEGEESHDLSSSANSSFQTNGSSGGEARRSSWTSANTSVGRDSGLDESDDSDDDCGGASLL